MRVLRSVVLLLAACGDDATSTPTKGSDSPIVRLDLPRLDEAARVMVVSGAKPAAIVWISATGKLEVGKAGPTWAGDITTKDRIPAELGTLRRTVLEAIVATSGPAAADAKSELDRDLDHKSMATLGTQQALARARATGLAVGGTDPGIPKPGRLASASTLPIHDIAATAPLVIATPSAPAATVARVLGRMGGALAVDHGGKLAVLGVAFAVERVPTAFGTASWLEIHADASGLHLVTQPDGTETEIPWQGSAIDRTALRNAYTAAAGKHVDVIVREDTTTQTLVDMLAALDALGAKQLAVAEGPSTVAERRVRLEAARKFVLVDGTNMPVVLFGNPSVRGDRDPTLIRVTLFSLVSEIRFCYEKQLLARPYLEGTMATSFVIEPDGSVGSAHASGLDPEVAGCVAAIIKQITFAKSDGQVNAALAFTFKLEIDR